MHTDLLELVAQDLDTLYATRKFINLTAWVVYDPRRKSHCGTTFCAIGNSALTNKVLQDKGLQAVVRLPTLETIVFTSVEDFNAYAHTQASKLEQLDIVFRGHEGIAAVARFFDIGIFEAKRLFYPVSYNQTGIVSPKTVAKRIRECISNYEKEQIEVAAMRENIFDLRE